MGYFFGGGLEDDVRSVGRAIDDEIIQPVANTVEAILDDPKKLAMVALAVMAPGAGAALGSALGLSGTAATLVGNTLINTAFNGGDVEAALKSSVGSYVGAEFTNGALAELKNSGLDAAVQQGAARAIGAAASTIIQGGDPVQALISGGVSGAVPVLAGKIPGYSDLPEVVKRSANAAMVSSLLGKDATYAAVAAALNVGLKEAGKQASAAFDVAAYAKAYPDLAAAFGGNEEALAQHYVNHGIAEGRAVDSWEEFAQTKNPEFDAAAYAEAYPDLAAAYGGDEAALAEHYANYGIDENRTVDTWAEVAAIFDPNFDAKAYAERYPDLAAAYSNDTAALAQHYVEHGINEGLAGASNNYYAQQAGFPDYATQQKYNNDVQAYNIGKYDDEFGDYQGAIDKAAARKDKLSFADAFAGARNLAELTGQDPKTATFSWTNPSTGVTGIYKANTADEINAQLAADQKRIDLMPVYGGSENTRTGKPTGAETVYIDTKTGNVVNDDRVFDEMGNVISGSIELSDNDTKVAALQTAIGSSIRTALDIGAGLIKGGAGVIEGAGTFAGLLGADMDNALRSTGKSVQEAVQGFRSNEFKADQKLMNDAIVKAGGEGNFAQAMETLIQFGTNPVQAAAFIAEQGVSLLVGGGAMTAARALGAGLTVAEAASLTANAVLQGASVASETYDEKKKQGATDDEAKNSARAAGALSGLVSAVANKFIPGAMSGEQMIAAQTVASTALKTALKGEMSSELVEETVGKVIQNVAAGKAWDSDLGTTAVQALIGSGVTTGLVHTTYSALDPIQSTPPSKFDGVTPQEIDAAINGFSSQGYTPSVAELAEIVNGAPDATPAKIESNATEYADQRVVSEDEATKMLTDLGYENPTQDQINEFVGVRSEADTKNAVDQWVNTNTVSREEARQQLIDLGYSSPPDAMVDALVGQYDQSQLGAKSQQFAIATKTDVENAIAKLQLPAGLSKEDVAASIKTYMDANPGITLDQVASKITEATKDLATTADVNKSISDALKAQSATQTTQIANLNTDLTKAIADARAAGLTGDQALQSAIDKVASDQKTSSTDLLSKLGATESSLKTQFASDLAGVKTQMSDIQKSLSEEIQAAKDIGLQGDAALQAGLDSLSQKMGVNQSDVLKQLGTTAEGLKTQFATELATVQKSTAAEIANTKSALESAIADAKAAGLSGDQALQSAIDKVAASQKTSSADLLSKLGATEASLKTEFASGLAGVSADVAATRTALETAIKAAQDIGLQGDAALQAAISSVAADQKTSAADLLSKLGTTEAALRSDMQAGLAGVSASVADTKAALQAAIADAKAAGLSGDQALQSAIDKVAADQKTSSTDLLGKLGATAADLKTEFAAGLAGVSADVASTRTALEDAIKAATDIGLKGDAALQAAIDSVATEQNVSKSQLLTQLGTTEQALRTDFAAGLSGLSQQMTDQYNAMTAAQKAEVAARMQQGADMQTAMAGMQSALESKIAGVNSELQQAIATNEAAGLTRDQAITKAVDDVAANLGTTRADLLSQMGTTEQALRTEFTTGISSLSAQMQQQYANMTAAQKAEVDARVQQGADLQTAVSNVQASLQQQIGDVQSALSDAIATNEAAGLSRDQAISKAVDDVAASVGTTRADLLGQIGATEQTLLAKFQAGQAETAGQIAGLSQQMQQQYAAMTAAQKAEVDARVKQGADLQAAISTVQQTVAGQVADTEARLTEAIKTAEAMGLSRDQAITAAVESVASELNTTKDALLSQLGTTEQALRAQFTTGLAGVSEQVRQQYEALSAAQKAEADARVAQGASLEQAIAASQQQTAGQIAQAESRINQAMASAEAAGMSRDQALSSAVDTVAADLGTTRADLLAQMGTTEANLLAKMQANQAGLQEQITGLGQSTDARIAQLMQQGATYQQATQQAFAEVNAQNKQLQETLGTQGRTANQSDIDLLSQMVAGQRSPDLSYDTNGDNQITQADIDFLTGVVSGTNTGWKPNVGSPWGPTGLYAQQAQSEQRILSQQEAAQKAAAEQAAANAAAQQAQAAANAKAQQQTALRGQAQSGVQGLLGGLQALNQNLGTAQPIPLVETGAGFSIDQPLNVGLFGGYQASKQQQKPGATTKIATGGYLDGLLDILR